LTAVKDTFGAVMEPVLSVAVGGYIVLLIIRVAKGGFR